MAVIRASASGTEHSVLAREIAVWPNLTIPYQSGPGGLSERSYLYRLGTAHMQCSLIMSSPALVRYGASISSSK